MRKPRLNAQEVEGIKAAFLDCFPPGSELYLFGSRADATKKGGDIDLYVETPLNSADEIVAAKIRFLALLFIKIGEQKVDVVVKFKTDLPIHHVARQEGIRLI